MSEEDYRLEELDRRQTEADRMREHLDALLAWSMSLPILFVIDLRDTRTRVFSYLDQRDREIGQERRDVEREIAEEEDG